MATGQPQPWHQAPLVWPTLWGYLHMRWASHILRRGGWWWLLMVAQVLISSPEATMRSAYPKGGRSVPQVRRACVGWWRKITASLSPLWAGRRLTLDTSFLERQQQSASEYMVRRRTGSKLPFFCCFVLLLTVLSFQRKSAPILGIRKHTHTFVKYRRFTLKLWCLITTHFSWYNHSLPCLVSHD